MSNLNNKYYINKERKILRMRLREHRKVKDQIDTFRRMLRHSEELSKKDRVSITHELLKAQSIFVILNSAITQHYDRLVELYDVLEK